MRQHRPDRTLGAGHDTFWQGCDASELTLPRCAGCGKLIWPIAAVCDHCGGDRFEWESLSGRGTIIAWGTFHQDYYRGVLPVPYETILVELAEGPLFMANPDGFGHDDITAGMAVEVAFLPAEDTAGPFSLPVFRKATG